MNQLKKNLLVLAVAVSLVVVGASTAFATSFQAAPSKRTVRVIGLAEAAGSIDLATSAGGLISDTSQILLDYQTEVVAEGVVTGSSTCDITGGTAFGADCSVNITTSTTDGAEDDSVLVLTFGADIRFGPNSSISIKGVRFDATAVSGTQVIVLTDSFVPAAAEDITYIPLAGPLVVAETSDMVKIKVTPANALLTCAGSSAANPPTFKLDIDEVFNQAIAGGTEEWDGTADVGFGPPPSGLGNDGEDTEIEIEFADVPEDVTITLLAATSKFDDDQVGDVNGTAFTGGVLGGGTVDVVVVDTSETADAKFKITFTASATTGSIEKIDLFFTVEADADDLDPGPLAFNADITVDAGDVVDDEAPDLGGATVFDELAWTIADCVSDIILPWVVGGALGFDTGAAFSNTTRDDSPFGVDSGFEEQTGACVFTGYTFDTGTQVGPYTSDPIGPGETLAFNFSTVADGMFAGFVGQVLVECGFQGAHAFAFITDGFGATPEVAQGYLGVTILTVGAVAGRDVGAVGELGGT